MTRSGKSTNHICFKILLLTVFLFCLSNIRVRSPSVRKTAKMHVYMSYLSLMLSIFIFYLKNISLTFNSRLMFCCDVVLSSCIHKYLVLTDSFASVPIKCKLHCQYPMTRQYVMPWTESQSYLPSNLLLVLFYAFYSQRLHYFM
jgi:hypothetical protein